MINSLVLIRLHLLMYKHCNITINVRREPSLRLTSQRRGTR